MRGKVRGGGAGGKVGLVVDLNRGVSTRWRRLNIATVVSRHPPRARRRWRRWLRPTCSHDEPGLILALPSSCSWNSIYTLRCLNKATAGSKAAGMGAVLSPARIYTPFSRNSVFIFTFNPAEILTLRPRLRDVRFTSMRKHVTAYSCSVSCTTLPIIGVANFPQKACARHSNPSP